jgi:O-methyltransferase involved in polyketide biosynthesis
MSRTAFLDQVLQGKKKVLILTEGLLMYLIEENVRSLAHALRRSPVSWWIIEILSPGVRGSIMKRMKTELAKEPMLFAPANGVSFFEDLGWSVLNVRSLFHEAKRLRRLPWLLNAMARLPEPDPRNVVRARWSGVARLSVS